ncbi:methyl-accepting chemotaxis protein [Vibrio mediterranei]|uniref:methyl-accepting chemotaxis protein n=1 Tax=Vibrio mediterranei TaxID=689 RepID=UPI00183C59B8|nr:methyl-accepting chemotaxis protein [Vibrio mediterranei]NUW73730.1 methyl-accepting chemotaxis protein [Vibrio mediterranei]
MPQLPCKKLLLLLDVITEKSLQIAIVAAEQTVVSDDFSQRLNMIEQSGTELRSAVEETEQATRSLNQLSLELYQKIARFEVQ